MDKNQRKQARVLAMVVFLFVLPFKCALLSLVGIEVEGRVISLSTPCENGRPVQPKPNITAAFFVGNEKHEVIGQGGSDDQGYCGVNIQDSVKVTYLEVPGTHYVVSELGNVTSKFLIIFCWGIFLNILLNAILFFLPTNSRAD
jgi:hypothetical protein